MQTFITASAVAALIGLADGPAFLRARERLEELQGFPLPMPTSRRPLRWRRDQVAAWADAQGRPAAQMPDMAAIISGAPNVVLMQKARAA